MVEATIQIALEPDDDHELARLFQSRLSAFNVAVTADSSYRPLVLVARKDDNEIIGGLLGELFWGALAINILWVDAAHRGQGIGAALVARAEAEARTAGCAFAQVDTMEYQARGFYEKLGYACFGEVGPYSGKYMRYYLAKKLGDA